MTATCAPARIGKGKVVHMGIFLANGGTWTKCTRNFNVTGTGAQGDIVKVEAQVTCKKCLKELALEIEKAHAQALIENAQWVASAADVCYDSSISKNEATEDKMSDFNRSVTSVKVGNGTAVHFGNDCGTLCGAGARGKRITGILAPITCARCTKIMAAMVLDAEVEAHMVNEKLIQVARLEAHPSQEARVVAYKVRDEIMALGFKEQAVMDVKRAVAVAQAMETMADVKALAGQTVVAEDGMPGKLTGYAEMCTSGATLWAQVRYPYPYSIGWIDVRDLILV